MTRTVTLLIFPIVAFVSAAMFSFAEEKKAAPPIKALLVTGGGYHDYKGQEKILTEGVSKRFPVKWGVIHKDAKGTKEALSKKGWADDYDIVILKQLEQKLIVSSLITMVMINGEGLL